MNTDLPRRCASTAGERRFFRNKSFTDWVILGLGACLKTRPVRAPGLQRMAISAVSCRPRVLTRRGAGVFKQALRPESLSLPKQPILGEDKGRLNCCFDSESHRWGHRICPTRVRRGSMLAIVRDNYRLIPKS